MVSHTYEQYHNVRKEKVRSIRKFANNTSDATIGLIFLRRGGMRKEISSWNRRQVVKDRNDHYDWHILADDTHYFRFDIIPTNIVVVGRKTYLDDITICGILYSTNLISVLYQVHDIFEDDMFCSLLRWRNV